MNMDGLSPHQLQGPLFKKKMVLLRSIDHFYRILVVPHFKTHMLYEQKIPASDFLTILRSDSLMIWWFIWLFSDQLSALALYCSSVSSTSNSPPPARFNFSTSCQDIWYMFHYYTVLTLLQIKKWCINHCTFEIGSWIRCGGGSSSSSSSRSSSSSSSSSSTIFLSWVRPSSTTSPRAPTACSGAEGRRLMPCPLVVKQAVALTKQKWKSQPLRLIQTFESTRRNQGRWHLNTNRPAQERDFLKSASVFAVVQAEILQVKVLQHVWATFELPEDFY